MHTLSLHEASSIVDLPPIALIRLRHAGRGPQFIFEGDEIRYPYEELCEWNDLVRRFWITEEYEWTKPPLDQEFDFSLVTPADCPVVRLNKIDPLFAASIRHLAGEGCFPIFSLNGEPVAAVDDLEEFYDAVVASSWDD